VRTNTQKILNELEDAQNQVQISRKLNRLDGVWTSSTRRISNIETYVKQYGDGKITEEEANKYIKNTISNWALEDKASDGENAQDMLSTVEQLLADFNSVSVKGQKAKSFPQIVREHVQTYVAFDHLGYQQRASLIRYYQFVMAPAYYLYKLYRIDVDEARNTDPIGWQSKNETYEGYFNGMNALVTADSLNMNKAYENYRVFRPNLTNKGMVIYYKSKILGPYDFGRWIDQNRNIAFSPPDNYKNKYEDHSVRMWNEVTKITGDKSLLATHDDYVRIYSEYPDSSLYNVLKYEGGFIGSRLYKEKVTMNGYDTEFHYFHWWPRDLQVKVNSQDWYYTLLMVLREFV